MIVGNENSMMYDNYNGQQDEGNQYIDYPFEEVSTCGDENRIRGNWSSKTDFFLSVFGFTFGLGNLWRFPYQLSVHGGVAYLIPYTIMFFFIALPVLFMELALGQFISLGPIAVWKVAPLFKGIGVSMVFISCILAVYYNMITTFALYYMVNSLKFSIPWASCGNVWNSENCTVWNRDTADACRQMSGYVLWNGTCILPPAVEAFDNVTLKSPLSATLANISTTLVPFSKSTHSTELISSRILPSLEYFHNHVLMLSSGLTDLVTVNSQLAICLFVAWFFVFICSFKGVKTSGKVVYFTVIMPYIIIFILFARLLTLPGSIDGVYHFFKPNWNVLRDLRVWGDAAVQVFYSLSLCTGGLTTLSSYNRFHNNVFFDIWIIGIVDFVTSIVMSALVFLSIGFVYYEMDVALVHFEVQEGIQLVFVFFAEALSKLPVAQLYILLFFGMISLIIFNSELFIVETIVSSICDEFPARLRRNHRHVLIFVLLAFFILGIPLCTSAGFYWILWLEKFIATWPLIIIAFFQIMIICWVYGADNFMDNLKWMIRYYPPIYIVWRVFWKFVCPLILLVVLAFVWVEYQPIFYDSVIFSQWSTIVGWTVSFSPLFIIFFTAIYKFFNTSGTHSKKWRDLLCPEDDWGPALALHRAEVYPMQVPEAQKLVPFRSYCNQDENKSQDCFGNNKNKKLGGYKNPIYNNSLFGAPNLNGKYSLPSLTERETII